MEKRATHKLSSTDQAATATPTTCVAKTGTPTSAHTAIRGGAATEPDSTWCSHRLPKQEVNAILGIVNVFMIVTAVTVTAAGPALGKGQGGLQPPHFFGNFKELLRTRCFQPPHFESLVSPPPPPPHFQSNSAGPVLP